MSSFTAPGPWPAPSGAAQASVWRFARLVQLPGRHAPVLQWVLRRNCSITPRQLIAVYLSLCAVSLLVGVGFWWQGATYVLAFAGAELLLVTDTAARTGTRPGPVTQPPGIRVDRDALDGQDLLQVRWPV